MPTTPRQPDLFARTTTAAARAAYRGARAGAELAAAHPAQFTPLAATAAVTAAGCAEQTVPAGWGTLATAIALAGYLVLRRTRGARARRAARSRLRRAYYAATALAALTYLLTAAVTSPFSTAATPLLAWSATAANLAWWARALGPLARRRGTQPQPEPQAADDTPPAAAAFAAWWESTLAAHGSALAGSTLRNVECDEVADRAVIQLNASGHTYRTAHQARVLIARTRKTSLDNITIERTPDRREDQAILAIYRRNPLHRPVPYTGPVIDYATGRARIAMYADNTWAHVRLWREKSGAIHELVCGASDAGKSRYLDLALTLERHCLDPKTGRHLIVSWVADPQEGQSLPEWQTAVDRFEISEAGALAMLEDAYAEMCSRSTKLAAMKWTDGQGREHTGKAWYDPDPDMPILSITIDEANELLKDSRIRTLVEKLVKRGRKCGVRVRLVTQIPSMPELGNSLILRPLLAAMNVVCLRTAGTLTDNVLNLPGDPADLPAEWPDGSSTAGLGYVGGGEMRPAQARIIYVDDPYGCANSGTTAHLPYEHARAPQPEPAPTVPAPRTPSDADPQAPAETPESATAGERILTYLAQRGCAVTTGILVSELNLRPSTVTMALTRLAARGKVDDLKHGLWGLPGADIGPWAAQHREPAYATAG